MGVLVGKGGLYGNVSIYDGDITVNYTYSLVVSSVYLLVVFCGIK